MKTTTVVFVDYGKYVCVNVGCGKQFNTPKNGRCPHCRGVCKRNKKVKS